MEMEKKKDAHRWISRALTFEVVLGVIALICAVVMVWTLLFFSASLPVMLISAAIFIVCVGVIVRMLLDPESVRARQTDLVLRISSSMVDLMSEGMTPHAAQGICELLLPRTAAIAVAITDTTNILGYAGYMEAENPQGALLRTQATRDTLTDGLARVLYSPEEIGLPKGAKLIKAAIILPIECSGEIVGTLKFYFRRARHITQTQLSIAQGLGKLLSTEVAASRLEEQRELATAMELKMLQSQINPHFLFNTINTIASLIRTDPSTARTLLREFAVFYRSTLENSQDQIELSREIDQTRRYFMFEVARFGEERLEMRIDLDSGMAGCTFDVMSMMVPPFLLQPIVENAVKHAMPAEGKLIVSITAEPQSSDVLVHVSDNGIGMDDETCANIMNANSQTGLGIAVKNVNDRMRGFYGSDAEMTVESVLGEGTTITLRFPHRI